MASHPDDKPQSQFEQLSEVPQPSLAVEFLDFLKHNKKWWLLPILAMIALFGILMMLASSAATPFIYALF